MLYKRLFLWTIYPFISVSSIRIGVHARTIRDKKDNFDARSDTLAWRYPKKNLPATRSVIIQAPCLDISRQYKSKKKNSLETSKDIIEKHFLSQVTPCYFTQHYKSQVMFTKLTLLEGPNAPPLFIAKHTMQSWNLDWLENGYLVSTSCPAPNLQCDSQRVFISIARTQIPKEARSPSFLPTCRTRTVKALSNL